MSIEPPLVSCIMITANRPAFVASSIEDFLTQNYKKSELIIIDDGSPSCAEIIPVHPRIHYYYNDSKVTIGSKRNYACRKSTGQILVHWDDDDWYAPDWISRQVNTLIHTGADITGLGLVRFFSEALKSSFVYEGSDEDSPWVCGATMAYKKYLWENYKFVNQQIGEDADFIKNSGGKIAEMTYMEGFTAKLHANNTSIKYIPEIIPVFDQGKLIG
ncbi:glycosyltransferase family 2 protein [Pedobacter sp. AW31-3R]|uniref:glycosyltransferase family 2 protein n=1 Tax=Pedobacter sp. AW31-3R TaxID=3445781 RepID=UPI003F9EED72